MIDIEPSRGFVRARAWLRVRSSMSIVTSVPGDPLPCKGFRGSSPWLLPGCRSLEFVRAREDRSTGDSRGVLEDRGAIRAEDRPPRCPEIDDRPRGGVLGAVDFAPVSRARGSPRVLEGGGWARCRSRVARVPPGSSSPGLEDRRGVLDVDRPRVCRSRSRRIARGFSPRCSISTGARRCPGARCRSSRGRFFSEQAFALFGGCG